MPKSWILFFGALESGIRENFACGIRNPELSNPKYSSRNPESHKEKSAFRSLLLKGKRNE